MLTIAEVAAVIGTTELLFELINNLNREQHDRNHCQSSSHRSTAWPTPWLLRLIHLSTTADQKDYEDASCGSQRTIRAPTQHSLPWNLIFPHRKAVFLWPTQRGIAITELQSQLDCWIATKSRKPNNLDLIWRLSCITRSRRINIYRTFLNKKSNSRPIP